MELESSSRIRMARARGLSSKALAHDHEMREDAGLSVTSTMDLDVYTKINFEAVRRDLIAGKVILPTTEADRAWNCACDRALRIMDLHSELCAPASKAARCESQLAPPDRPVTTSAAVPDLSQTAVSAECVVEPGSRVQESRLARAWRWLRGQWGLQPNRKRLRVCESVSLGEKRFAAVIQVDGEQFLVGGAASSVSTLARLQSSHEFHEELKRRWSQDAVQA